MKVNGTDMPCAAGMTVQTLLDTLGYDKQRVAVERNGQIVPRAHFDEQSLCGGDTIEIVCFVGGG